MKLPVKIRLSLFSKQSKALKNDLDILIVDNDLTISVYKSKNVVAKDFSF